MNAEQKAAFEKIADKLLMGVIKPPFFHDPDVLDYMLNHGGDLQAVDEQGKTLLDYAHEGNILQNGTRKRNKGPNNHIIMTLLKFKPVLTDADKSLNQAYEKNFEELKEHFLFMRDSILEGLSLDGKGVGQALDDLLEKGLDLNRMPGTALELADSIVLPEVVGLLIRRGALYPRELMQKPPLQAIPITPQDLGQVSSSSSRPGLSINDNTSYGTIRNDTPVINPNAYGYYVGTGVRKTFAPIFAGKTYDHDFILNIAIKQGHYDAFVELLNRGANPVAACRVMNCPHSTALHLAAMRSIPGKDFLGRLLSMDNLPKDFLEAKDKNGNTALQILESRLNNRNIPQDERNQIKQNIAKLKSLQSTDSLKSTTLHSSTM